MTTHISTQGRYIGSRVRKWVGEEFINSVYYSAETNRPVVLHAPPASGKTFSAIKQGAGFIRTGEWQPITFLTRRHNLYRQAAELASEFNLSYEIIPAPRRSCPSFDTGTITQEPLAVDLYERGVSGRTLHKILDLSCEGRCEYVRKLRAIEEHPSRFDLLIGHPLHANITAAINDRIVIFDEFPVDIFVTTFDHPGPKVNRYLTQQDIIPVDDWKTLTKNRDSDTVTELSPQDAFTSVGPEDLLKLPEHERFPRIAPNLVAAVITGTDLGNGIEYAEQNGRTITLFEKERQKITIFNPPSLRETTRKEGVVEPWAIVGLDGTPCQPLWNLLFPRDMIQRSVLSENQRRRFEKSALGLTLYGVGRGLRPFDGAYVYPDRDSEILREIQQRERQRPDLITTKNAERMYRASGVDEFVKDIKHYGEIKSMNEFSGSAVGCVFGAPHPGDPVIKRFCGILGLSTNITGKGMEKTYGGQIQNTVFEHFVHDKVYQAVMRFVRGQSSATVYVNTESIDKWIKPDGVKDLTPTPTPTKDRVLRILQEKTVTTVPEASTQVDASQERIRQIFSSLEAEGWITKKKESRGPHAARWKWVGPGPHQ